MKTTTISGLYDIYDDAQQTVRDIAAAGVPEGDISLIANNSDDRLGTEHETKAAEDAGIGAAAATVVGGGAGLLAGLGILAIPGIGPVVAAGWLAATALGAVTGAVAGGAAGGLVGSMTSAGIKKDDADVYAEGIRRGGTLVAARVDESHLAAVTAIIAKHRAIDPQIRGAQYRENGWSGFDAAAAPHTPSEADIERSRKRIGLPL